ncbi:MAG: Zn-dependent hydrolase [Bacteroidales bacterium]|nr:Zn-dependent hydrolase [Bacteroidales bacterium]MDY6347640.1 Zn-dependent hydrolase [Bacteroidales bacterium]
MKRVSFMMLMLACVAVFTSCGNKKSETPKEDAKSELQQKVEEYAYFDLTADLSKLSESERKLLPIFFEIGQIMDDLFWEQTFGDKSLLDTISDPWMKEFAMINYGPWDRLDEEKPFVPGYGPRPAMGNYYPQDITKDEYEALSDPLKSSHYTVLTRDAEGNLKVVGYYEAYKEKLDKVCELLDQAIEIADNPTMKKYLVERRKSLQTNDYYHSDMAWMDLRDSNIDFVFGPIENYDDGFNSVKTSFEAFVLVKDVEASSRLDKFVQMLPQLQKELPCDPKHKNYVPGTSSDMNLYDVVFYGGDCNAAGKTIAINLPNDDKVQAEKGSRRFQLRNAMQAKFDKIMKPIGEIIIEPSEQSNIKFDAFFWNVTFHEVAHGLGVKQTINGKGSVDEAMQTENSSWEEAKADIVGLNLVCNLIEKGEITDITVEEAITTYIVGLLRSVRFGAAEAHGIANMMCYNYLFDNGAFTRNGNGTYHINYDKARKAIDGWIALILKTQAEGDFDFASQYSKDYGKITPELQKDLDKINKSGIPRDIRFNQGLDVLGVK